MLLVQVVAIFQRCTGKLITRIPDPDKLLAAPQLELQTGRFITRQLRSWNAPSKIKQNAAVYMPDIWIKILLRRLCKCLKWIIQHAKLVFFCTRIIPHLPSHHPPHVPVLSVNHIIHKS